MFAVPDFRTLALMAVMDELFMIFTCHNIFLLLDHSLHP